MACARMLQCDSKFNSKFDGKLCGQIETYDSLTRVTSAFALHRLSNRDHCSEMVSAKPHANAPAMATAEMNIERADMFFMVVLFRRL